jgi:hypothetical protein
LRSTLHQRRIGRLAAYAGAILLVAACTEPAQDLRSAAPTGSLTPAASASASTGASGYSRGNYGTEETANAGDTNGQGKGGSWFVAAP